MKLSLDPAEVLSKGHQEECPDQQDPHIVHHGSRGGADALTDGDTGKVVDAGEDGKEDGADEEEVTAATKDLDEAKMRGFLTRLGFTERTGKHQLALKAALGNEYETPGPLFEEL